MHLRSFTIRRDYLVAALVMSGLVNLVVACSSTKAAPPPSKGPSSEGPQGYSAGGGGGGDGGEEEDEPDTASDKGSGSGGMWDSLDPNCTTKDSCPSATPRLLLQGSSTEGLAGQQGTRLSWRLNAVDQAQPTRRLAIFLKGLPSGFNTEPPHNQKITNELQLSYIPPQAENGVIEIFVRDYDRCLVTETEKAVCLSTVFNQAYDFRQPNLAYQFQGTSSANRCPPKKGLFEQTLPGC